MLHATALCFAYHPDAPVLRDVSVTLAPGRVAVLIGPNGSGKSTLIKLLTGELRPTAGQITWDDKPLHKWRPRELARVVAYLPQSPAFEPGARVAQVLAAGRTPYLGAFGLESRDDLEIVRRVAAELGIDGLLARPIDQLSGGQRQLVFLGRALAQEPRALLLDEPGTFLDLRHQVDLWRRLRTLATERQIAVLAASHELQIPGAVADEVTLLAAGRIAATGPADRVLRPEVLSPVYGVEMEAARRPGGGEVIVPRV